MGAAEKQMEVMEETFNTAAKRIHTLQERHDTRPVETVWHIQSTDSRQEFVPATISNSPHQA